MACFHGVPGTFCAICNNAMRPRDDSHPMARPDLEPRFAKGRDSAKWVGIGTNLKLDTHNGAKALASAGNIYRKPIGSAWRQTQAAREERRQPSQPAPMRVDHLQLLAHMRAEVIC